MPHDPSRSPRRRVSTRRRAARLVLVPVLALLATGCTGEAAKWSRGGWPAPVTDQGEKVLGLWRGSLVASAIIGGAVLLMIIGSAVLFRRRSMDQLPRQVRYNLPIEVLYTFIPVVIVATLFYFTAGTESREDSLNSRPAVRLGVVGFQWSWQFNYLDQGLSITGRAGNPPTLVVPVGEQLHFYETSPDVIHAFWVIPFLFKRDVIPGRVNQFELTVNQTGVFRGKCTEFCGVDHDRMLFTVRALTPTAFKAWLAKAKQQAAAGTNPQYSVYGSGTQGSGT